MPFQKIYRLQPNTALLHPLPLLLLGTSRPLKSREPKRRERERPRKGSLLLSLALTPVLPHPIVLCASWILDLVDRRRRFRELGKTGFFCPWRRGLIRSGPGAGVAP